MLRELHIKNVVLIEQTSLQFQPGLNTITGETGAGKSVLVCALGLVLGERLTREVIRPGAEHAEITAVFEITNDSHLWELIKETLTEIGVEDLGGEILMRRVLSQDGRNRCFLNDAPVTLKSLQRLGDLLVDFHGQHEHQTLMRPKAYLELVDAYAGNYELRKQVKKIYHHYQSLKQEYKDLSQALRERARIQETLTTQLQEIDAAELEPHEETQLEAQQRKLQQIDQLTSSAAKILMMLEEGSTDTPPVAQVLGECLSLLEDMARSDPELAPLKQDFLQVGEVIDECIRTMTRYQSNLEQDPAQLDIVNQRLHTLARLKRKYGGTIEEVLHYRNQCAQQLDELEGGESRIKQLESDIEQSWSELAAAAQQLSETRAAAGHQLGRQTSQHLTELAMESGSLVVEIQTTPQENAIGPAGWDRIEFNLRTNAGTPYKPLRQIASGGEVSRVMLAIKAALAGTDPVDVLLFDEIDAGIGGTTCQSVADKLAELSQRHQVLVITHLPQIASRADAQFMVSKQTDKKTTQTTISPVCGVAREEEIMRMLGDINSPAARAAAQTMLNNAKKTKPKRKELVL